MSSIKLLSRSIPSDTHCCQRLFPCHSRAKRLPLLHVACGRAACFCGLSFSNCHTRLRLLAPHNRVRSSHDARAGFSAWTDAYLPCTSLRRALISRAAATTCSSRTAPPPPPSRGTLAWVPVVSASCDVPWLAASASPCLQVCGPVLSCSHCCRR